jgi:hypothetical protein
MILKISPADVVSIPTDYNNSKGRTCKYEVIGELGVNPEEAFTAPVQENANTQSSVSADMGGTQYWPNPN